MCAAHESEEREHVRLLLQVCRRYYQQEQSQAEIADALGYSRSTISRLLTESKQRGVVRFHISHPLEQAFEIERQLRRRFELPRVGVAVRHEGQTAEAAVGSMVADWITQTGNQRTILALSNGRSVAAVVEQMPVCHWPSSVVTQMVGSLGSADHQLVDSPDLCRRLAQRLGGTFRPLPVPIVVGSANVARSILREELVLTTIELAARSDIALVGVGAVGPGGATSELLRPFLTRSVNAEIRAGKAVAHISGHHFDAQGRHVHTSLCDRTVSMPPERLAQIKLPILVAWGADKVPAIHAMMRTGMGLALATDEPTARLLLSHEP